MNITHLSSDVFGGAARAATRLHNAINTDIHDQSRMIVLKKNNDDWRITGPLGKRAQGSGLINSMLDRVPAYLQHPGDAIPRSVAWRSSLQAKSINQLNTDIVHLHWICSGFLSIEMIGRINKPLVWTLHDMWAFCGAEHLAPDGLDARWRIGYEHSNRDAKQSGLDVDRWVWLRKQKAWKKQISIVAPSRWLADCACSSALMREWNVTVIPNTLDIEKYKPCPKSVAREVLGLPSDAKLVLFGAIRGTQSPHKGWDLLERALGKVAARMPDVQAVIFGQSEPEVPLGLNLKIHWLGHLHDDATLALLYSAADVLVVPSRQEAFGQTGSEAQACGCPVVAFDCTGLKDVVDHQHTGFLAKPFCSDDLAHGIEWVLADPERHQVLSAQARERAVTLWSYDVVAPQYRNVYERAIKA